MIRNPMVRQPLSALMLGLTLGGCYRWSAPPGGPSQLMEQTHPSVLRVHRREGQVLEIARPQIVGDSIHGVVEDAGRPPVAVVVALSDVQRVETRHFRPVRTYLMVGGVTLLLLFSQFLRAGG